MQSSNFSRRKGAAWVGVVLSAIALAVAFNYAEADTVVERLEGADLRWLGPTFAVSVLQLVVLGLRWSTIARRVGVEISFGLATTEYALSRALNQVLPSGIAGDGVRALRHARTMGKAQRVGVGARVVEALALDRISGQLGLWAVVVLTSPLASHVSVFDLPSLALAAATLVGLGAAGWFVVRRIEAAQPALRAVTAFARRGWAVLCAPRQAVVHLSLSWISVALLIAQFYFAGRAIGVHLAPMQLLWIAPMMLAASSVPSFFGSWGVREGVVAMLFASIGLSGSTGLAVSVVYGTFDLLVALPGLVVLLVDFEGGDGSVQQRWLNTHAAATVVAALVAAWLRVPTVLALVAALSLLTLTVQFRGRWTPSGAFGAANAVSSLRLGMTLWLLIRCMQASPLEVVTLAVGSLLLDAVDGWVARRNGTSAPFGACFDVEIDALLVMSLAVALYVRDIAGVWVLAAGLWRYLFVLLPVIAPTTRRESRRSRLGRIAYVAMVGCFVSALLVPAGVGNLLASLGTGLISLSFIRSLCELYLPAMPGFRSSPQ